MQKLKYLTQGELIAIVAPAGRVEQSQILPAIEWLEGKGFRVKTGKYLFQKYYQFSARDHERAEDLQDALDDPEVRVVLFARGGYGTVRIISRLNFSNFNKHPKWLAGFSDITLLHNVCRNMGIPSLHGPMCRNFMDDNLRPTEEAEKLLGILMGEKAEYSFESPGHNRKGSAAGQLTGGNLSLLYSLLGTSYDVDTKGKILFLEETNEYLYHIDRMMNSLRLAGKLEGLKALVAGQFTDTRDNPDPFGKTVQEIIMEAVEGYSFPVCFGLEAGHGGKNLPLVFGKSWKLQADSTKSVLKMV